mmetsp:Transcript_80665/g.159798  ORF Transcript_80665/g.159798 Transcript_80665/m.159798 type:complete len:208 (-) Transcript_80665:337-960(-)
MSARGWSILRFPRAKECNLVLTVAATKKPHTVVICKAIDPGAMVVHSLDVLGFRNGPCVACFRGHRWSGAAIWDNFRLVAPVTSGHGVTPLVVKKFEARCITARWFASMRADGLQVHRPGTQVIICWALIYVECGTVDLRHRLFTRCSAGATLYLKLEGQGPPINEADVHGVAPCHFTWHRGVTRLALTAPSGLKLGINRWSTPRIV